MYRYTTYRYTTYRYTTDRYTTCRYTTYRYTTYRYTTHRYTTYVHTHMHATCRHTLVCTIYAYTRTRRHYHIHIYIHACMYQLILHASFHTYMQKHIHKYTRTNSQTHINAKYSGLICRDTHGWLSTHTQLGHSTHLKKSCHTYELIKHIYQHIHVCVTTRTW